MLLVVEVKCKLNFIVCKIHIVCGRRPVYSERQLDCPQKFGFGVHRHVLVFVMAILPFPPQRKVPPL